MPNLILSSYRSGNRAEYFAQYVLSALGVASPVIRQEDIGIDFHCMLSRKEGKNLHFDSSYAVQVGAIGSKMFRYGVGGKKKKLKHKPYETAWLFSQSIPLFLATVDHKTLTIRLYTTSPMWITYYSAGSPAEVVLIPDAQHDPSNQVLQPDLLPEGFGNRRTYHVPLFKPVDELDLTTFTEKQLEPARMALRKAIATERKNLRYRDLGVHFVEWLLNIVPNDASQQYEIGHWYAWNATPGQNVDRQLESLLPIIIALGQNLSAQGNTQSLEKIVPAFGLFNESRLPNFVADMIKKFREQTTH